MQLWAFSVSFNGGFARQVFITIRTLPFFSAEKVVLHLPLEARAQRTLYVGPAGTCGHAISPKASRPTRARSRRHGGGHDTEIEQHAEFVAVDPFFRNLSLAKAENGDNRPPNRFAAYRMTTKTTDPFATVHGPVAHPARHAVFLREQIVDGCRQFAIHLGDTFKELFERCKLSERFWPLRSMNNTVGCNDVVKNSHVPLLEGFQIATNDCFVGCRRHLLPPRLCSLGATHSDSLIIVALTPNATRQAQLEAE